MRTPVLTLGMMVCQLERLKTVTGEGQFKWRFQLGRAKRLRQERMPEIVKGWEK